MFLFDNSNIEIAKENDLVLIETLLNIAYRGEESKSGWTTESHLIAGNIRSNSENLLATYNLIGSVFLKYTNVNNQIIGCVNLQEKNQKIYLGMLAVNPNLQNGGVGKKLLNAAKEWAVYKNCKSIYMTVISERIELIDWYKRNGYIDTNKRIPFEEDNFSGKHLKKLEFIELELTI